MGRRLRRSADGKHVLCLEHSCLVLERVDAVLAHFAARRGIFPPSQFACNVLVAARTLGLLPRTWSDRAELASAAREPMHVLQLAEREHWILPRLLRWGGHGALVCPHLLEGCRHGWCAQHQNAHFRAAPTTGTQHLQVRLLHRVPGLCLVLCVCGHGGDVHDLPQRWNHADYGPHHSRGCHWRRSACTARPPVQALCCVGAVVLCSVLDAGACVHVWCHVSWGILGLDAWLVFSTAIGSLDCIPLCISDRRLSCAALCPEAVHGVAALATGERRCGR
mmetsp:Transcript_125279/g.348577  ORF Transcript_125279/g.348577 Transcript_125279/m.348577 type:complete len:278 (-) Transcript_125279:464-1297(-)